MRKFTIAAFLSFHIAFAFGQKLTVEQQKTVTDFIDCIRHTNQEKLISQIRFPFERDYPIPSIKNGQEFINRYAEIFDDSLTNMIVGSDPSKDWSAVGWHGIMLFYGQIWLDYDGRLLAVNYQSTFEKREKARLIELEKREIHESVKEFENPVAILETAKYRIRIDDLGSGNYRYASWPIQSTMSAKPQIVIKNGKYIPEGSGGNHSFVFKNGDYVYVCLIVEMGEEDDAPAYLKVSKGKKELISQSATIVAK